MKYFSMFSGIGGFELGILLSEYAHIRKESEQGKCSQRGKWPFDEQELQ